MAAADRSSRAGLGAELVAGVAQELPTLQKLGPAQRHAFETLFDRLLDDDDFNFGNPILADGEAVPGRLIRDWAERAPAMLEGLEQGYGALELVRLGEVVPGNEFGDFAAPGTQLDNGLAMLAERSMKEGLGPTIRSLLEVAAPEERPQLIVALSTDFTFEQGLRKIAKDEPTWGKAVAQRAQALWKGLFEVELGVDPSQDRLGPVFRRAPAVVEEALRSERGFPVVSANVDAAGLTELSHRFVEGLRAVADDRWKSFRYSAPDGKDLLTKAFSAEISKRWRTGSRIVELSSGGTTDTSVSLERALHGLTRDVAALREALPKRVGGIQVRAGVEGAEALEAEVERRQTALRAGGGKDPELGNLIRVAATLRAIDALERLGHVDSEDPVSFFETNLRKPMTTAEAWIRKHAPDTVAQRWTALLEAGAPRKEKAAVRVAQDLDDAVALLGSNASGCMNSSVILKPGYRNHHALMACFLDPSVKQLCVTRGDQLLVRGRLRLTQVETPAYAGPALALDWAIREGGTDDDVRFWVEAALTKAAQLGLPVVTGNLDDGGAKYSPYDVLQRVADSRGVESTREYGTLGFDGSLSPWGYSDNLLGYEGRWQIVHDLADDAKRARHARPVYKVTHNDLLLAFPERAR